MMEQAVKAPSGHNTQPWLFRVQKDRIQILPDMSKSLPAVDPDNRELFISLGCATENLCIAAEAKGYAPLPVFSGSGEITVLLSEASMIKETSGLIEEISVRQTNRGIYSGEMIPSDQLSYLRNTPLEENISLHLWSKGEWEFDTLSSYIFAGNNRQMNDHLFKRELKSWMRFNKNHVRATSDGLSYAVFGAPNLPRLISETIMGSVLKVGIQNRGDKKKLDSSSHLALFALRTNTLPEWFALGRSLQRFLLRATEKNIAFAFLNQPCEVRDLSGLLAKDLSFTNEIPALILRLDTLSGKCRTHLESLGVKAGSVMAKSDSECPRSCQLARDMPSETVCLKVFVEVLGDTGHGGSVGKSFLAAKDNPHRVVRFYIPENDQEVIPVVEFDITGFSAFLG